MDRRDGGLQEAGGSRREERASFISGPRRCIEKDERRAGGIGPGLRRARSTLSMGADTHCVFRPRQTRVPRRIGSAQESSLAHGGEPSPACQYVFSAADATCARQRRAQRLPPTCSPVPRTHLCCRVGAGGGMSSQPPGGLEAPCRVRAKRHRGPTARVFAWSGMGMLFNLHAAGKAGPWPAGWRPLEGVESGGAWIGRDRVPESRSQEEDNEAMRPSRLLLDGHVRTWECFMPLACYRDSVWLAFCVPPIMVMTTTVSPRGIFFPPIVQARRRCQNLIFMYMDSMPPPSFNTRWTHIELGPRGVLIPWELN